MHCPRCGQQQVSDETKFCSRCGFQLGLVSELLANNGFLPQLAELYNKKQGLFNRKNGVIFSIIWFIIWVMMIPAFFGIADIDEAAGASAVFGLFTTLIMLVISIAFLPSSKKKAPPVIEGVHIPPASLYGNAQRGALPPQQTQPASSYVAPHGAWRSPDTGELVSPGSVTDGTTKLLKEDSQ